MTTAPLDADPERRLAKLEALAAAGAPLEDADVGLVLACLDTPRKAVQRLAADLLGRVEAPMRGPVAARLRSAIGAGDPRMRWGATYALGRLGIVELDMLAPLLEALGIADGDVRWAAAELMTACARVHPGAIEQALLDAAADPVAERRKMALYVLRDVAPASPAVRGVVLRGLRDPAVGVRFAALAALARLEPLPPEGCQVVLALVRDDPNAGVRRAAVSTLGTLGRGVSAVEDALAAAAASDDPGMRRAARAARHRLAAVK